MKSLSPCFSRIIAGNSLVKSKTELISYYEIGPCEKRTSSPFYVVKKPILGLYSERVCAALASVLRLKTVNKIV